MGSTRNACSRGALGEAMHHQPLHDRLTEWYDSRSVWLQVALIIPVLGALSLLMIGHCIRAALRDRRRQKRELEELRVIQQREHEHEHPRGNMATDDTVLLAPGWERRTTRNARPKIEPDREEREEE